MSDNAILSALRRMGYQKDEMSGHGFRAMASTLLYENGFPGHCIELQLDERVKMMDCWANYLDGLK